MAGMEIPVKALREYIENAIDIVVEMERLSDGRRRVTNISEIVGFKDDTIELRRIFGFDQTGVSETGAVIGDFIQEDYIPLVYDKITARGIKNLKDIFETR
jgi:pilus assembly protein CpaF